MANIREVIVDWTTLSGPGKVSVFHFAAPTVSVATQRAALGTMLMIIDSNLVEETEWSIRTEGRILESTTGELTGSWTDATVREGAGGASGNSVTDPTQVLLRWRTGQIRNGRFLIGRTFIPGLNEGYTTGGNIAPGILTTWGAAMSTFVGSASGFGVWGKPSGTAGAGVFHEATGSQVWSEAAVLRRRRG